MPTFAPEPTSNFEVASQGQVQGVIAGFVNLGMVTSTFEGKTTTKPQIKLIWQLNEKDSQGRQKYIHEWFTFSLHEKAKLAKRLLSMFGKLPPRDFDYEKLVGYNYNLMIVQEPKKDGSPKAKIVGLSKLAPGVAKLELLPLPKREEV